MTIQAWSFTLIVGRADIESQTMRCLALEASRFGWSLSEFGEKNRNVEPRMARMNANGSDESHIAGGYRKLKASGGA